MVFLSGGITAARPAMLRVRKGGFYILRKSGSNSFERIATVDDLDASSYLDTDVETGKEYTYTVQRFLESQTSEYDKTGLTISGFSTSTPMMTWGGASPIM